MSSLATGVQALRALPLSELLPLVAFTIYFGPILLIAFAVRCLRRGVPRAERIASGSQVVPRVLLEYGYWVMQVHVRLFIALRMSPNAVSLLSLVLATGG